MALNVFFFSLCVSVKISGSWIIKRTFLNCLIEAFSNEDDDEDPLGMWAYLAQVTLDGSRRPNSTQD